RITELHGKPTVLVTRLNGGYEPDPGPVHCRLTGETLAQAHLQGQDFEIRQPNLRGLDWWIETAPKVRPFLDESQAALLDRALDEQIRFAESDTSKYLPSGPAHCDLF